MVLVSVIMASYNHERYLSEAIESVLNQTSPDLELVIVDDCSKDHSREIIEAY
jgi:glycosyltransferase involved in cell wall biosynthesis